MDESIEHHDNYFTMDDSTSFAPVNFSSVVYADDNNIALVAVLTLMALIIMFGCGGNMLVIVAVCQTKKLQTASNLFVANLSACDLLFVSLVLPVNMYTYVKGDWPFTDAICTTVALLGYTLTGTTIMTITSIAWNRYKLVVDPKSYHETFRRRNLVLLLAATWLVPIAFLQPAVFGIWGHFSFIPMLSSCNLGMDKSSQSFKIFLLIVRAAIPCALIIYFYSAIYLATRASRIRIQKHKSALSAKSTISSKETVNESIDNQCYADSSGCLIPKVSAAEKGGENIHTSKDVEEQGPGCKCNRQAKDLADGNNGNIASETLDDHDGQVQCNLKRCRHPTGECVQERNDQFAETKSYPSLIDKGSHNQELIPNHGGKEDHSLNHYLKREMRLTRMMVGIFLVFVLSYFPCTVSSVIDTRLLLSRTFHLFCQTTVFLSSAVNPLLYGFMNTQFREAYYDIVTCNAIRLRHSLSISRRASTAASSMRSRTKPQRFHHEPMIP